MPDPFHLVNNNNVGECVSHHWMMFGHCAPMYFTRQNQTDRRQREKRRRKHFVQCSILIASFAFAEFFMIKKKRNTFLFLVRDVCFVCVNECLSLPPSLSLSGQLFVFHQFGINSKLRTKSEFELNTNQSHLIFCSLVTRAQAHRFACRLTESCVAGDSVFCAIVLVCNGQCCFQKCSPLLDICIN